MGDTKNANEPAFSNTWVRRALIVVAVGAAFWLGWIVATARTGPLGSEAGVNGAPTGAPAASVRLELDAGTLTLLPDTSLRLPPLPSVDPDALYRDSLPPSPSASSVRPSHTAP